MSSPISPISPISLIGLILLLASCSSGGEGSGEPAAEMSADSPISFSSGLADKTAVTRSQGLETSASTFQVWAYKNVANDGDTYTTYQTVMPGFTVNYGTSTAYTTTSNTHDWEYVGQAVDQTIKYWDWSAKAYRFFGVAGGTYTASWEANATDALVTFTADGTDAATYAATPYYSDLWFSTGNAVDYPDKQFGKPVVLTFRKPFALVNVVIHNSEGEMMAAANLEYFKFKPTTEGKKIATQAPATITYPLQSTAANAVMTCELGATTGWLAEADGIYREWANVGQQYVLPATSQGNFQMTIKLKGVSEPKTCQVPGSYFDWKMGYEYTYIVKVDFSSVHLEAVMVGIKDWGVNDLTHDVYNW